MEKGPVLVHLAGIAQSLGLFFLVCLATAAFLSLAVAALARMERATLPARRAPRAPSRGNTSSSASAASAADRVSSRGGCGYGPKGR